MKKIFSMSMIALMAVAMLFVACKKDENNNGNTDNPGGGGTVVTQPDGTIENAVVTDIDGNVYNGVWLNSKLWMKENLRTTKYADGTTIPSASADTQSSTEPHRYAPGDNESNVSTYGYLYNWPAAVHGSTSGGTVQGACPNGWHVPSNAEWENMIEHLNTQEEYLCNGGIAAALCANSNWEPMADPHPCLPGTDIMSNNATGFSALPAGIVNGNDSYVWGIGYCTSFWSSTGSGNDYAWSRSLHYDYWHIGSSAGDDRSNGYSVRCVRN